MSAGLLIQIVFDIFIAAGFFVIIMRMNRAPKDDPRLSRGLQLLQSKISVLEDLSDRTESQVSQLVAILENKGREVQAKVQLAEQHVHEIRMSMERSLEVAKIFQDKIPHKEIIERQNTIKYVQAARLAHQGKSVEEISATIDLPKGEIEFITSVNRDRLTFSEDQLPEWARQSETPITDLQQSARSLDQAYQARQQAEMELAEQQRLVENLSRLQGEMKNLDVQLARENAMRGLENAFEAPKVDTSSLKKLGEEFRRAVEDGEKTDQGGFLPLEQLSIFIPQVDFEEPAGNVSEAVSASISESETVPFSAPAAAPVDPVLARAVAQQKVANALKAMKPQAPKQSQELKDARSLAREAAKGAIASEVIATRPASVSRSPVINPSKDGPVVKKVLFPRIDESEI